MSPAFAGRLTIPGSAPAGATYVAVLPKSALNPARRPQQALRNLAKSHTAFQGLSPSVSQTVRETQSGRPQQAQTRVTPSLRLRAGTYEAACPKGRLPGRI